MFYSTVLEKNNFALIALIAILLQNFTLPNWDDTRRVIIKVLDIIGQLLSNVDYRRLDEIHDKKYKLMVK